MEPSEEDIADNDKEFESSSDADPDPSYNGWFSKVQEEKKLMELTGCDAMTIRYKMPVEMRAQYLSHDQVMEKAKPFIIAKARQKAGLPPEEKEDEYGDDDDEE